MALPFTPYAYRVAHKARHGVTIRRRPMAYLHSLVREAGDYVRSTFEQWAEPA